MMTHVFLKSTRGTAEKLMHGRERRYFDSAEKISQFLLRAPTTKRRLGGLPHYYQSPDTQDRAALQLDNTSHWPAHCALQGSLP